MRGFNWARIAALVGLVVTAVLIVGQLSGWEEFENLDALTVGLLLTALVLAFAAAAPHATREFFERLTTLKLPGGVELGLQAVSRAERVQGGLLKGFGELPPDLMSADDVQVPPRPLDGGAAQQFEAVREMLLRRLRFVHKIVLGLPEKTERNYPRVLDEIDDERLLKPDESALVRDLLGRAEHQIERLPYELRTEFLDASWRFSVRFASLTHERLVRKRLSERGWALLDFQQARAHRPDFLAYRDKTWLMVAARVEPRRLTDTRRRLARGSAPFGAQGVIVLPDKETFKDDGLFENVPVVQLRRVLKGPPRRGEGST